MNKQQLVLPESAKPIPGFSGYFITRSGELYSTRSGEVIKLKTRLGNSGYISATVTADDGSRTSLGIHRLLALAYLSHDANRTEVNHIDGNKFNNNISNLEWCSHSENEKHKVRNFMTERTKPVVLYNFVTKERIILPSTREADRYLNLPVNSISNLLKYIVPNNYGDYIVSFLKR